MLLVAFGGPEDPSEIRPFLARVLAGRSVPADRIEQIAEHYEAIGGRSPLCEITRRQASALEAALEKAEHPLPVRVGMRNSAPFLSESLRALHARGSKHVLAVIMAAHESPASHGRYREALARALADLGADAPELRYAASFHDHHGFVDANLDHVGIALRALPDAERAQALLVFTAHSIPETAAQGSSYVGQLEDNAAQVARALGRKRYRIAYQSRSGAPSDPWLTPDINDLLREEAKQGTRAVVLVPIGFVCDHVEVLYDLDVEAAQTAKGLGIHLARAQAVNDHPSFIEALTDRVREA